MRTILECKNADDLLKTLKSSKHYNDFKSVLSHKVDNEQKASLILKDNLGKIKYEHIRRVFGLVDENYMKVLGYHGGPWFGRLIKPNGLYIFNETEEKINQWIDIIANNKINTEEKINTLLKSHYHIYGAGIGLVTLMLYLMEKKEYLIWFGALHEGLRMLYPDLGNFKCNGAQYDKFNNMAKTFAKQYGFDHSEMDWILSAVMADYKIVE